MADNTSFLSSFTALTPTTHLYTPISSNLPATLRLRSASPNSNRSSAPSLIIICAASTPAARLGRYISGYMSTYPSSSILVLSSSSHSSQKEAQHNAAIAEIIAATRRNSNNGRGQVLLHAFGDEGEIQAAQLAWAHRLATERTLEAKAIVYDAIPGSEGLSERVRMQRQRSEQRKSSPSPARMRLPKMLQIRKKSYDYNTLSPDTDSLPSVGAAFQYGAAVILSMLFSIFAFLSVFGAVSRETVASSMRRSCSSKVSVHELRRDLDDPELIGKGCRKCYVYPGAGLIACLDVTGEAENDGFKVKVVSRRDSGMGADYDDEHENDEMRGREWTFGRVGDDAFWEGIRGVWMD